MTTEQQRTIRTVAVVGVVAFLASKTFRLFGADGGTRPPVLPSDLPIPEITVPPTLTLEQARVIADSVYFAIYGDGDALFEDEDLIIASMLQARNDADVVLIGQEYGVRSGSIWGADAMNIFQAIQLYLSVEDRAAINSAWASEGITLRV